MLTSRAVAICLHDVHNADRESAKRSRAVLFSVVAYGVDEGNSVVYSGPVASASEPVSRCAPDVVDP